MNKIITLATVVAGMLVSAHAPAEQRTAEEVRTCSRANLPESTMVQSVEMRAVDVDGNSQRIRSRFFLKRYSADETRATLQVRAPLQLEGVSYLMIDRNNHDALYLYLPTVGRTRRISGKQASSGMLNTDFSYEDIKQLRAVSAGGEVTLLDNAEMDGRAVHRLELRPGENDDSGYDRIVFAVDQQTCVALEAEFYEPGARHVKTLAARVESLQEIEGRWMARELRIDDHVRNTHTLMTLLDVEYDEGVSNTIFNRASFYLAATLGWLLPQY
jgi:hypothetical protein